MHERDADARRSLRADRPYNDERLDSTVAGVDELADALNGRNLVLATPTLQRVAVASGAYVLVPPWRPYNGELGDRVRDQRLLLDPTTPEPRRRSILRHRQIDLLIAEPGSPILQHYLGLGAHPVTGTQELVVLDLTPVVN